MTIKDAINSTHIKEPFLIQFCLILPQGSSELEYNEPLSTTNVLWDGKNFMLLCNSDLTVDEEIHEFKEIELENDIPILQVIQDLGRLTSAFGDNSGDLE